MDDRFTDDAIKEMAAKIAELIAGDRDILSLRGGTSGAVCPPKKLCCFEGYNCDAPFVCLHGFLCPNGFGAGVIWTRR